MGRHPPAVDRIWAPFRLPDSPELEGIDVYVGDRHVWSSPVSASYVENGERIWGFPTGMSLGLRGTGEMIIRRRPDGAEIGRYPVDRARGSSDELVLRTGRGADGIVNKWGNLAVPVQRDPEMQQRMLDHTSSLMEALKEFGLRPFLMAGMLLGAVRDGDLLPHEEDGDIGYVSSATTPADMMLESYRLERFLAERGFESLRHSGTHLQIDFARDGRHEANVDVFGGFYLDDWFIQPFQVRARIPRDALEPTGRVELRGVEFDSPADPEPWLEANYGTGWKVPDPAFRFVTAPESAHRMLGWFGAFNGQREFWEIYYDYAEAGRGGPSAAAKRLARNRSGRPVIDLGCGTGDDAVFLAQQGRRVIAIDASKRATNTTRERTEGLDVEVIRMNLVERRQVLDFIVDAQIDEADILVHRVLESLPGEERDNALLIARHLAGRGEVHVGIVDRPDEGFTGADPRTWWIERTEIENRARGMGFELHGWRASREGARHIATAVMTRRQA